MPGGPPTEEFLNFINASNPSYTGWPVWIDSRGYVNEDGTLDEDAKPYTYGAGWEAFIYGRGGGFRNRLDFWLAEPAGRFYHYRALQDDFTEGRPYPEAMTTLDPFLVILRTAEAIAVPMVFARAMASRPR